MINCSSAGMIATNTNTIVATRGSLLARDSVASAHPRHRRRQPSPRRRTDKARRMPMTKTDTIAVASTMG